MAAIMSTSFGIDGNRKEWDTLAFSVFKLTDSPLSTDFINDCTIMLQAFECASAQFLLAFFLLNGAVGAPISK